MTTTVEDDDVMTSMRFETVAGQSTPAVRSLGVWSARPTYESDLLTPVDLSSARLGSRLLGLPLLPQGERVARLLEARDGDAARFPDVVVQMPRRATKTTSIWATILGRAATRPGYRCVTTAQSGTTASRILLSHATLMLAAGSLVESRATHADSGLPVLYRNGGRERIVWPSGSTVWVVPPDAGAVRSEASDDIVVDEGGELDPLKGKEFLDAVKPLMDTRGPLAQFILAGTPGKVRVGPFWDALVRGRAGADPDLGIIDYSIRDDEDIEDRHIWRRVHPGPDSGLTPMRVLEKRWRDLGPDAFAREYLCRWPDVALQRAIDSKAWRGREVDSLALPERFALGVDCAPDGSAAAIAAAWRVDGLPYVALLERRPGTDWVPGVVRQIVAKHRGTVVAADQIGANTPIIEALGRLRPPILARTPGFRSLQGACATFAAHLPTHQAQPDLDAAIEGAVWRSVEGGRLFGRKSSKADVSPLVASTLALWAFDGAPAVRPKLSIVSR